jgi:oligosaccharide repeat unit polymerase
MWKNNLLNILLAALVVTYLVILGTNIDYVNLNEYSISLDVISILVVAGTLLVVRYYFKVDNTATLLTPDKLFILLYLFMIYPGIIFLSSEQGQVILIYQSVSLVFFILGVLLIKKNSKIQDIAGTELILNRSEKVLPDKKIVPQFILFFSIVLILIYLATGNFNRSTALTALLELFQSGFGESIGTVNEYRRESVGSGMSLVIGNYISSIFLPIAGIYFLLEGKKTETKTYRYYGIIIIIIATLFNIGTGSRLMTLKVFLYFAIVYSMLYSVNLTLLIKTGITIFLVLVLTTSLLGRGLSLKGFGPNIARYSGKAIERIFLVKGRATLTIYEYYPRYSDFENGYSIFNSLLGNFDENEEPLAVKMFAFSNKGKLGTAGPQTFGDLYANFGYFGQLVGAFLVGLLVSFVSVFIFNRSKFRSFDIAIIAYIFLNFGYMGYSETIAFKVTGLHIVLTFYLMYVLVRKI